MAIAGGMCPATECYTINDGQTLVTKFHNAYPREDCVSAEAAVKALLEGKKVYVRAAEGQRVSDEWKKRTGR